MSRDLESLRPRTGLWAAMGIASLLAHGGVAAGLASYEPPPPPPIRIPVEVRVVEPPPPPPEPEKPPEPEPPPPPPEPETPREAVVQDDPPPPPKKPRRKKPKKAPVEPPKPNPAPPPAEPTPDKPPEPPPMIMGTMFEGLATSNNGVAVPQGAHDGARDGAADGTGRKGPRAPTPPGDGDETVPIAGVSSLPRLIEEVKPDFPDELKRQGVEGKVVLSLEIGSNGRVRKARVVARLHPELDTLARKAAKRLVFEPAKVGDTPVAVNLSYTFYFVID